MLVHKTLCHCLDDDVDGPTLLDLTAAMTARLLHTMKLQVRLQPMMTNTKDQQREQTVTEVHTDTALLLKLMPAAVCFLLLCPPKKEVMYLVLSVSLSGRLLNVSE